MDRLQVLEIETTGDRLQVDLPEPLGALFVLELGEELGVDEPRLVLRTFEPGYA